MTEGFTGAVFIAASIDGYIASADGGIDWLDQASQGVGETGYEAFVDGVDALVLGRGTYETALGFGFWPYEGLRVFVLSTSDLAPDHNVTVVAGSGDLYARLDELAARPGASGRVYVDGGRTIQTFLRDGRIDELTITRIPLLLGGGIPLFGLLNDIVWLDHQRTVDVGAGLIQSTYRVRGAHAPAESSVDPADAEDRADGGGEVRDFESEPVFD